LSIRCEGDCGPDDVPAGFLCEHCGHEVSPEAAGTAHRNHCPHCLWSVHLDDRPGDRRRCCRGAMEPIGVWVKKGGEWAIVHRCQRCGSIHANRIAGDDNELALMSLAVKALAAPPFPLDRLQAGRATPAETGQQTTAKDMTCQRHSPDCG